MVARHRIWFAVTLIFFSVPHIGFCGPNSDEKLGSLVAQLGGKVERDGKVMGNPIVGVDLSSAEIDERLVRAPSILSIFRSLPFPRRTSTTGAFWTLHAWCNCGT